MPRPIEILEELYPSLKKDDLRRARLIPWLAVALLTFILAIVLFSCDRKPVWANEITPLSIAQSQIGLGEIGGNNKGYYVRQYLNGQKNLPWCAGFVSYCIKKAKIKIPYTLRARDFMKLGEGVRTPQANDLIIFSRQGGGHIGIIEKVTKDTIITIEGNLGEYPSKVKRIVYKRNHIKNLLGFVRIARGK